MSTKRTIGTMAALGGLTAAVALLSGMSTAKADELSDLRANQELLQQRVDQLAQAAVPGNPFGVGGPPGPTTVQMMGGSFPRSFLVPGTDTSIRVGGRITTIADYWFSGGNAQVAQNTTVGNNGQALSIPLNLKGGNFQRSRGNSVFLLSARESALNIETRTPTAWGEARTFMEWDWTNDGSGVALNKIANNLAPRFRYAYATLGGFLAGQANSNFSDSDAGSETIDFGGNVGNPGVVRLPQVRYTMPLAGWGLPGALSVSAEAPETEFWTPVSGGINASDNSATGFPGKAGSPDFTAAWYIPQPWGHVDFATVIRPTEQIKDGAFIDQTFVGYGGQFSGDVKPRWFGWDRDGFTWQFVAGEGLGHYNNTSTVVSLVSNYANAAAPITAAQAANTLIKPVTTWGGDIGYRHYWLPNLRSTISYGIFHQDIPTDLRTVTAGGTTTSVSAVCPAASRATAAGGCGLNKNVETAHLNLIWNPVPFANFGIEYMWGHRVTVSNQRGDENLLIGRFQVLF